MLTGLLHAQNRFAAHAECRPSSALTDSARRAVTKLWHRLNSAV